MAMAGGIIGAYDCQGRLQQRLWQPIVLKSCQKIHRGRKQPGSVIVRSGHVQISQLKK